uniref:Uncharacterized protein n=1 Tax=Tanacetum cinerariifolium TaxID=118510 RepID=A0A6L2N4Y8_TANCI|nr:hypothetical protein [Tanacetum cinerariifolium]
MEASPSTVDGHHRAIHRTTRIDLWSFKLIEVYIEHGVTALDSYLRAPQFRVTLEEITDEAGSIAANRNEKKLDGEAGFADVAGGGMDSSGLSHDESFGVDDIDLNLNELEFSVEDVVVKDYGSFKEDGEDAEQGNGQEDESAFTDGQFFYDDEEIDTAYETKYDVQYSGDAGTDDDDDDVDEDFLVDEENEIVEPDVDVHLFGISMDIPFDNIGITNLVSDDVLEGEDVYVSNADGFDSDPGQKFTTPKEAKDRVYLHSIENRRNLKLYKNDGVILRARCDGKVPVFTMSQGTRPTGPNHGMKVEPSRSSGPTTRSKKKEEYKPSIAATGLDSNNGIYLLAYALAEAKSRANSDLLLNNICKVFNGKIIEGVIDKCTGPLTPTATLITESIKKEAYLMKEIGSNMDSLNTGHNKATCKGQGRKATREPAVCQDGLGGSGVGAVVGLSAATGEGGAGVASEGLSCSRWIKRRVQTERISPQKRTPTQPVSQPSTSSQKPMSETRNADGREMGDGIPTQSSAAGGKQIGDFVDMPNAAVEQRMDANVPDEINGAKGEQVPNHVVKKSNLEFLVCKEVANPGVNELVDNERPLKRKRVYAE